MVWLCVVGMAKLLANLSATQELVDDFQITQAKTKHLITKENALRREKVQKLIVESLYLNTMATNYHIHFATYSNGKKNVT
jgi:hypothetical protein